MANNNKKMMPIFQYF